MNPRHWRARGLGSEIGPVRSALGPAVRQLELAKLREHKARLSPRHTRHRVGQAILRRPRNKTRGTYGGIDERGRPRPDCGLRRLGMRARGGLDPGGRGTSRLIRTSDSLLLGRRLALDCNLGRLTGSFWGGRWVSGGRLGWRGTGWCERGIGVSRELSRRSPKPIRPIQSAQQSLLKPRDCTETMYSS